MGIITGSSRNITVKDFELDYAEKRILADFGDTVSVNAKLKSLVKFGRNESVGTTGATIMTLPGSETEENLVSSNSIDTISSSVAGDTSITLTIEGHTISGSNLTFVVQTATLDGTAATTKVVLTTPLARVTRAYNTSGTELTGAVYVYEDDTTTTPGVPDTDTKVHLIIPAGQQQSKKAQTSISQFDYWIITEFRASVLEKVSGFADVQLQVKSQSGVWRPVEDIAVSSDSGTIKYNFAPYLIIPKNSEVRLWATSDAADRDISGSIQGYLALIQ